MIDEDQAQQNQIQNQFKAFDLKFNNHNHDGRNGFKVDYPNLLNVNQYGITTKINVVTALVLTLHTVPQVLVPAQGVNSCIIVEGITAKIYYNGTAYTGANNLEFRYTDSSGAKLTDDIANTFINSGNTNYAHVSGRSTYFNPTPNAPIVVLTSIANPAVGNSNIIFIVKYRVISL